MLNLQIIFLIILLYNFYLTFAFYRFTKDNKEKVSLEIGFHHTYGTFIAVFTFFLFPWYLSIIIVFSTILIAGSLSARYGMRGLIGIDTTIFKHQKKFIIVDIILIVYVVNMYFKLN